MTRILDKLETVLVCTCPNKADQINFRISELPSLSVESTSCVKNSSEVIITVRAKLLKLGYGVPQLTIVVEGATGPSVYLPFAIHNFLMVSPAKIENGTNCEEWVSADLLKPEFMADPSRFSMYIQGLRKGGNKVKLGSEVCLIELGVESGKLLMRVESRENNDTVLRDMILTLLVRMLTEWRRGYLPRQ